MTENSELRAISLREPSPLGLAARACFASRRFPRMSTIARGENV